MNSADFAAVAPWAGIQGKPEFFPPAPHRHASSDIERSGADTGDVLTWDGRKFTPQSPRKSKIAREFGAALARFEETLTVVADDQKSLVEKTTDIEARFADSSANFTERIAALATKTEARVTVEREIVARLGDAEAKIKRTDEVLVSKDRAIARVTEEISSKIAQNVASITTLKQTTVTRDTAEAIIEQSVAAAVTSGGLVTSASLTTTLSAYATTTFAEAKKTEAITAAAADATARVLVETTARASADTAIASTVTTVSASVDKKVKVQSSAPSSPALNDVWIDTSDSNKAKYWNGSAWVYKQDLVLYAAVVDESTARATSDGYLAGSRVIGVDVGGRVTGMRITAISDPSGWTTTSEITFNASVFKIYDGSSNIAPFTVSGGYVRMTNAIVAGELDAGTGDNRLYKPVAGAMTYGNTSLGHVSLQSYAAGASRLSLKYGSTSYGLFGASVVGSDVVGDLRIYGADGTTNFSIIGSIASGASAVITWSSDANLYRLSANNLKTDYNFLVGGTLTTGGNIATSGGFSAAGQISAGTNILVPSGFCRLGDGSAGSPGLNFNGSTNTGWFLNSAGDMRASTSGTTRFVVRDAAIVCLVPLKLDNSFVGGAPSATGYVTMQDASGTTYKFLVGT